MKGWKLVTSSTNRKDSTLSGRLQVPDRSTTLKGEEEPVMPSSKNLVHIWLSRKSLVKGKEMQEWQKGGSGNRINWNKEWYQVRNTGGGLPSDTRSKDIYKQWGWLVDWDLGPSFGVLERALLENPQSFPSCLCLKDLVWGMVKIDGLAAILEWW